MANETATALVHAAGGSAFQLFKDKQFRRLAGFEQLSQVDQDRIFNELVVASLVLIMLVLEAPDLRIAAEFRGYLSDLNKKIPKAHVDYLRASGVATKHLRDWKNDLSKIQMLVPVQAVAIGCHHHICRGDTEGQDDLFKLTLRSLSRFYVELRVRFEGGRITLLTRMRVTLKRILERIRTGRKNQQ